MHNHNKINSFPFKPQILIATLSLAFWSLLIFAFDTPYAAVATLIAVAAHEIGHKIAFFAICSESSLPLPGLFGFKIKSNKYFSYQRDIITAAAGPLANLILCLLALPLTLLSLSAYKLFAIINIAAAISNLLPIKGYDGYKILYSILHISFPNFTHINIVETFSLLSVAGLCFFSLYLIGKRSEGYWIFLIFFCTLLSEISKSKRLVKNENIKDFKSF